MESDRILQRAEELLNRVDAESRLVVRASKRQVRTARQRLTRAILYTIVLALAAMVWGLAIAPLGVTGVIIVALLFLFGAIGLLAFPRGGSGSASDLPKTALSMLPISTEEWLASQRKALPAPAQKLVDGIGLKLETLSDQLRALDEKEPAALEIRRLLADELPELVTGYQRVPVAMRKEGLDGLNPDRQLVDGLSVVDSELQRMSVQLASGDLHKLATQGRYLELKYQGELEA
jgi:hypothetical protein